MRLKILRHDKILEDRFRGIDYGGRGGIRTHETLARLLVFKTSAFNRSATRPLTQRFTRKFDLNQELAVT